MWVRDFFITTLVLVINITLDAEVLEWKIVVNEEVVNENDTLPTSERESILLRKC